MSGLFIVIEGGDGVGTTTQALLVHDWLQRSVPSSRKVHLDREPTTSDVGQLIRRVLCKDVKGPYAWDMYNSDVLAMLFTADRLLHTQHINKIIGQGDHIISDRYFHSTLVYQGLLENPTKMYRVLGYQNSVALPDATYILDAPLDETKKRRSGRSVEEIFDLDETQKRVLAAYKELPHVCATTILIDGTGTKEDVLSRITRDLWNRFSHRILPSK